MPYAIKDKDLAQLNAEERELVLDEIVAAARAPKNGQAAIIDARIEKYEQRYEMSSDELLSRLAQGHKETAEIAQWLFWLSVRNNNAHGKTRTEPAR